MMAMRELDVDIAARQDERRALVKNLLEMNLLPVDKIAQAAKTTVEEVLALKEANNYT